MSARGLLAHAWVSEHCKPAAAAERRAAAEAASKPAAQLSERCEPAAQLSERCEPAAQLSERCEPVARNGEQTGGGGGPGTGGIAAGDDASILAPASAVATPGEGGDDHEVEEAEEDGTHLAAHWMASGAEEEAEESDQEPQPHWWCDVGGAGCVRPEQPTHKGQYSPRDRCWAHPNGEYMVCEACYRSGDVLVEHMNVLRLLEVDEAVACS
jgi:hypothetical protein